MAKYCDVECVDTGGAVALRVRFSYGVPVAGWKSGRGYFKTTEHHSPTSSKHANGFANRGSGGWAPHQLLTAEEFEKEINTNIQDYEGSHSVASMLRYFRSVADEMIDK